MEYVEGETLRGPMSLRDALPGPEHDAPPVAGAERKSAAPLFCPQT